MESEALIGVRPESKGTNKAKVIESGKIIQNWREFRPQSAPLEEEPGQRTGILFFPGFATPEWGIAVRDVCQETANFTGLPVMASEIRGNPTQLKQIDGAELDRQFIEKQGYNNLFVMANSQNGVRAAELIKLLQEKNPGIQINGAIFIETKGLGDHNRPTGQEELSKDDIPPHTFDKLTKPKSAGEPFQESEENFLARLINDPGSKILQHPIKNRKKLFKASRILGEFGIDFARQIIEAGGRIPSGVRNLRGEMVRRSPALSKIKCPVVLVLGEGDTQVNPNFVMNPDMGAESARQFARLMEAIPEGSPNRPHRNEVMDKREQYVHNLLFPESPAVKVLIAAEEKDGNHSLLGFRPRGAIRASFAALEGMNRPNLAPEEFKEYVKDRRRFTQPPLKKAA